MTHDEFLSKVDEHIDARTGYNAAEIIKASLIALAERITPNQRKKLAEQLPEDMKSLVDIEGEPETFDLNGFYERIGQRLDNNREYAEGVADNVMHILSEAVSQGEIENIKAELPEEYYPLFE